MHVNICVNVYMCITVCVYMYTFIHTNYALLYVTTELYIHMLGGSAFRYRTTQTHESRPSKSGRSFHEPDLNQVIFGISSLAG